MSGIGESDYPHQPAVLFCKKRKPPYQTTRGLYHVCSIGAFLQTWISVPQRGRFILVHMVDIYTHWMLFMPSFIPFWFLWFWDLTLLRMCAKHPFPIWSFVDFSKTTWIYTLNRRYTNSAWEKERRAFGLLFRMQGRRDVRAEEKELSNDMSKVKP